MKKLFFFFLLAAAVIFFLFFSKPSAPTSIQDTADQAEPIPTEKPASASVHENKSPLQAPTPPPLPSQSPAPPSPPQEKTEAALPAITPAPPPLPKDELILGKNGKLLFVDQREAPSMCAAKGQRLPTIRELARLAQSRGAKGILEVGAIREQDLIEGYKKVEALETNGKKDIFYYNSAGYLDPTQTSLATKFEGQRSEDGMRIPRASLTRGEGENIQIVGNLQYWSSSESIGHSGETDPDLHSYYILDVHGDIRDYYHSVRSEVRCVSDR